MNSHKIDSKSDPALRSMHTNDENEQVVKRVTVTLDDETHAALQSWADDEARTVPNLLNYLAMKAIKDRQSDEQPPKNKQ